MAMQTEALNKDVDVTRFLAKSNVRMSEKQTVDIILKMCMIIKSSPSRSSVSKVVAYFSSEDLKVDIICRANLLEPILKALCHMESTKDGLIVVDCKTMAAISNLYHNLPEKMACHLKLWWKLVTAAVVDSSSDTREKAIIMLVNIKEMILQNKEVFPYFVNYIISAVHTKMISLFNNGEELYILKLWKLLLFIFGNALHTGSKLINVLLKIPELAFRHKDENIKLSSYESWLAFIDNLASNPDVIDNVPRLKLLLQPFIFFNFSTKALVKTQVLTWWHITVSLGDRLQKHIELVIEPLLEICFGFTPSDTKKVHQTRRASNLHAIHEKPAIATSALQKTQGFKNNEKLLLNMGIKILSRLLEEPNNLGNSRSQMIGPLKTTLLLKSFLLFKHHAIIFKSLSIASSINLDDSQYLVILEIWSNLQTVVKKCASLESKMECKDFITSFFVTVKEIVRQDHLDRRLACNILELAATCPSQIIMSSSFVLFQKGSLHETPSLLLLELLMSKSVIASLTAKCKFLPLLKILLNWQDDLSAPILNVSHTAIRLFGKAVPHFINSSTTCSTWLTLAQSLSTFINMTKEVNQGDSLEHDYSCLYEVLIFPFQHELWSANLTSDRKLMTRLWCTLFDQLIQYATPLSAEKSNGCCLEFLVRFMPVIKEKVQSYVEMYVVLLVLHLILKGIRRPLGTDVSTSTKNLQSTERNIFGDAIVLIVDKYTEIASGESPPDTVHKRMMKCTNSLLDLLENVFQILKGIHFVNSLQKMASSVARLISLSSEKGNWLSEHSFLKLDKVWESIASELPVHFQGLYDTKLLMSLCPLFQSTLKHSRRSIQQNSRLLWNATFATTYNELDVPLALREVLQTINLSDGTTSLNNNETVCHDGIGGADKVLLLKETNAGTTLPCVQPDICASPTMPTKNNNEPVLVEAKKPNGVGKVTSEKGLNIRNSPLYKQSARFPKPKSSIRNFTLSVDLVDMNSQDFTLICTKPKPKQVLTEHQKEIRATKKSSIPALYADLSQDSACLFSEPFHSASNSCSLHTDPGPTAFQAINDETALHRESHQSLSMDNSETNICAMEATESSRYSQVNVIPESNDCLEQEQSSGDKVGGGVVPRIINGQLNILTEPPISFVEVSNGNFCHVVNPEGSPDDLPAKLSSDVNDPTRVTEIIQVPVLVVSVPEPGEVATVQLPTSTISLTSSSEPIEEMGNTDSGSSQLSSKDARLRSTSLPSLPCDLPNVSGSKRRERKRKGGPVNRVPPKEVKKIELMKKKTLSPLVTMRATEITQVPALVVSVPEPAEVATVQLPTSTISMISSSELIEEMGNIDSGNSQLSSKDASLRSTSLPSDLPNVSGSKRRERKRKGGPVNRVPPKEVKKIELKKKKTLSPLVTTCILVPVKQKRPRRMSESEVFEQIRARRRNLKNVLTLEKNKPSLPTPYQRIGKNNLFPAITLDSTPGRQRNDAKNADSSSSSNKVDSCPTASVTNMATDSPTYEVHSDALVSVENADVFNAQLASEDATASSELVWSLNGCISQFNASTAVECEVSVASASLESVSKDGEPESLVDSGTELESTANELWNRKKAATDVSELNIEEEIFDTEKCAEISTDEQMDCRQSGDEELLGSVSLAGRVVFYAALEADDTVETTVRTGHTMETVVEICQELDNHFELQMASSIADSLITIDCPELETQRNDAVYEGQEVLLPSPPSPKLTAEKPGPSEQSEFEQSSPGTVQKTLLSSNVTETVVNCEVAKENMIMAPSQLGTPSSILKKQKSRENVGSFTPSPAKKRKVVSFADPPAHDEENNIPYKSKSNIRFERGGRAINQTRRLKGSPKQTLLQYSPKRSKAIQSKSQLEESPQSLKFTEENTQESYDSPAISEVNCTDPIFPDRLECKEPISSILHKLTSTMWTRGLNNMLQSRNIKTIGDLCAMTEGDVQTLPIKSPKLKLVRQSLERFFSTAPKDQPSRASLCREEAPASDVDDENDVLPSLEDEMATWSPEKVSSNKNSSTDERNQQLLDLNAFKTDMLCKFENQFLKIETKDFRNIPLEFLTTWQEEVNKSFTKAITLWARANCNN